jgi:ACS family hexuronate transporter-like MFS transporter
MNDAQRPYYKWSTLALLTLSGTFVSSIPMSCMPALFEEISVDLGLDLVQIGVVWGISGMAGIFVSIPGGVLSDRFKAKHLLVVFCILAGITGAIRGLSNSFFTLTLTVFLHGLVRMVAPIVITRAVGVWFRGPRLGTAMGISAMGMGLGLFLGPMISASVLSPLLGGWSKVLYFYGLLSLLCGIAWSFFREEPALTAASTRPISMESLRRVLFYLVHKRTLWLLSLSLLLRIGGIMGLAGYLPLYLRGQGWTPAAADAALAVFYAVSATLVVPVSIISDRLGSRKAILMTGAVLTTIAIGLLPLVSGGVVWVLIVLAGMLMDGFMAINVTMLLETEGIGLDFAGVAIGIIFSISPLGTLIAPPLGNSFARFGPGMPFFFWASLSLMSVIVLLMLRETARRKARVFKREPAAP